MDYHLLQIFMKQLFRPVYPVLLYIPFCPLLSCSDLIILYSFCYLYFKFLPICFCQGSS
jgi:hypothetical protein